MTRATDITGVAGAVAELLAAWDAPGIDLRLCPRGCHLRAATAWRARCPWCGEPLATGDVGPYTWDTDTECDRGSWDHRHGCGRPVPPVEVTAEVRQRDAAPGNAGQDATALLSMLMDELQWAVANARRDAMHALRATLAADLRRSLDELAQGVDRGGVTTGSPVSPGVYHDDRDGWVAWDFDPASRDDPVVVTENDLRGNDPVRS